jgi:hypothetical protein
MWVLYAPDRALPLQEVQYGDSLPGFTVAVPPKPLVPGCYFSQISGSGRTGFRVLADGAVVETGPPW